MNILSQQGSTALAMSKILTRMHYNGVSSNKKQRGGTRKFAVPPPKGDLLTPALGFLFWCGVCGGGFALHSPVPPALGLTWQTTQNVLNVARCLSDTLLHPA